jgi:hypothetical protein
MTYKKTNRYVYRNIGGEGILIPVRDGICNLENMLILNETSTAIWENFHESEQIAPSQITNWLLEEYEVEKDQAEKDISEMLHDLVEARCLECSK